MMMATGGFAFDTSTQGPVNLEGDVSKAFSDPIQSDQKNALVSFFGRVFFTRTGARFA
jgi:hypothetical protein